MELLAIYVHHIKERKDNLNNEFRMLFLDGASTAGKHSAN